MATVANQSLTKEEENLCRYYHMLLVDGDTVPSSNTCMPYGIWSDVSVEMFDARKRSGVPGLKAYLAGISNIKEKNYRRLIKILSGSSLTEKKPELYTSQPLAEFLPTDICPPLPEGVAIPENSTHNVTPLKDLYVAYSKEKSPEGYEDFHDSCYWGMLSTVAARRVVIDLASKQYTPLIIQLAARSTLYAKTVTAEVQREVLRGAGLHWLLGISRTTPQKLLHDMSGPIPESYGTLDYETQEDIKRRLAMSGQRGWIYNEFGKLVKAMVRPNGPMADFIEILLQISDCPPALDTGTISRGTELIPNPYLAITGTLTPASIKAVAGRSTELWSDGFFARFVFSCPPPNLYNHASFKRGQVKIPGDLVKGLHNWHKRLGVPEIDIEPVRDENDKGTRRYEKVQLRPLPETIYELSDAAYDAWDKYRSALKSLIIRFNCTDFDGSYGRLSDAALRVAALAASVENAKQIEYEHWAVAQTQAEKWRESLHCLYAQVNSDHTPVAGQTLDDKVLECVTRLQAKEAPSARDIAKFVHIGIPQLEPTLSALVRNGVLIQQHTGRTYRYTTTEEDEL